uniref:Uncharacterized protein n=1 Tax=Inkyuleea mariana TaxID=123988 RepID=A0A4D6X2V8_9FLOR|nr:hypothetical protein [Inkyuleea mariana]
MIFKTFCCNSLQNSLLISAIKKKPIKSIYNVFCVYFSLHSIHSTL